MLKIHLTTENVQDCFYDGMVAEKVLCGAKRKEISHVLATHDPSQATCTRCKSIHYLSLFFHGSSPMQAVACKSQDFGVLVENWLALVAYVNPDVTVAIFDNEYGAHINCDIACAAMQYDVQIEYFSLGMLTGYPRVKVQCPNCAEHRIVTFTPKGNGNV